MVTWFKGAANAEIGYQDFHARAQERFCVLADATLRGALGGVGANSPGISSVEVRCSAKISKSLSDC
jgi:hypothetical protein